MRVSGLDRSQVQGDSGVYVLVLSHDGRPFKTQIGALGTLSFRPGFYCYVGSALRALRSRLLRHLSRTGKQARWHVDYLRRRTAPVGVLVWTGRRRAECELSTAVGRLEQGHVPGFGCTDCRCASHLYYFTDDPTGRLQTIRLSGMSRAHLLWRRRSA